MITKLTTEFSDPWGKNGLDLRDERGVIRAIIRYIADSHPLGAWTVLQQSTDGKAYHKARFDCMEAAWFQALAWEAQRLHRVSRGSGFSEEMVNAHNIVNPLDAAIAAVDKAAADMADAKANLASLTRPPGPENGG